MLQSACIDVRLQLSEPAPSAAMPHVLLWDATTVTSERTRMKKFNPLSDSAVVGRNLFKELLLGTVSDLWRIISVPWVKVFEEKKLKSFEIKSEG